MPSAKRAREENGNEELIRSLAKLKNEIKKMRKGSNELNEEKEEVIVELHETLDAYTTFIIIWGRHVGLKFIKGIKTFQREYVHGRELDTTSEVRSVENTPYYVNSPNTETRGS